MNRHVDLVASLQARQVQQGGVEDDPLRVPTLVIVLTMV